MIVRAETPNSLASRSAEDPRDPLRRSISERARSRSDRFTVRFVSLFRPHEIHDINSDIQLSGLSKKVVI